MAVQAKMRCTGRHELAEFGAVGEPSKVIVTLQPVADQEEKYKSWSKWTPCGELRLEITNPEAFKQLELGKVYDVVLSPEP